LSIGPDAFYVMPAIASVLGLDVNQLINLRDALSSFSAAHFNLVVDLLQLDNFEVLEMRSMFVPLMLEEPEEFLGDGFALGPGGMMEEADRDGMSDDDADLMPQLRLEILEQPPNRCVYRRNLRPFPAVKVVGNDGNNPNLWVGVSLLRCDTLTEMDPTTLNGANVVRAAVGKAAVFKRLKVQKTSHQVQDSHFALKFELREYKEGMQSEDYNVLYTTQSNPFVVLSHSTQLRKPQAVTPVVTEVIPSRGQIQGGTQVVLLGSNFMDSPAIRVRFDNTDVQPFFHGPRTLVCRTPPLDAQSSRGGPVNVAVCNDGKKWGETAKKAFQYVPEPDPVADRASGARSPDSIDNDSDQVKPNDNNNMVHAIDLNDKDIVNKMNWSTDGTDLNFILRHNMKNPLGESFGPMELSRSGGDPF